MDEIGVPEPEGWDDPLTGLEGPDFWQRVLIAEVARATKYRRPLTVVVAELEGLEDCWAGWGEDIGRHLLHAVAECLRRETRGGDYCTRIAPSRFGVILTETDEVEAINYVERVRDALPASIPMADGAVWARFGWASPKPREAPDSVVRRAERRLIGELTRGV